MLSGHAMGSNTDQSLAVANVPGRPCSRGGTAIPSSPRATDSAAVDRSTSRARTTLRYLRGGLSWRALKVPNPPRVRRIADTAPKRTNSRVAMDLSALWRECTKPSQNTAMSQLPVPHETHQAWSRAPSDRFCVRFENFRTIAKCRLALEVSRRPGVVFESWVDVRRALTAGRNSGREAEGSHCATPVRTAHRASCHKGKTPVETLFLTRPSEGLKQAGLRCSFAWPSLRKIRQSKLPDDSTRLA